jgi:hypothetical protein
MLSVQKLGQQLETFLRIDENSLQSRFEIICKMGNNCSIDFDLKDIFYTFSEKGQACCLT